MTWLTAVLTGFIEGCALGAIRVVLVFNCIGLVVYVVMVTYRYIQMRTSRRTGTADS